VRYLDIIKEKMELLAGIYLCRWTQDLDPTLIGRKFVCPRAGG
jgi:hypothetical protein